MGIVSVGSSLDRRVKGVTLLDQARKASPDEGEYVEFLTAGTQAAGQYHCSGCGYGVTVHAALPRCPMCGGTTWEPAPWSPFTRNLLR
jgi:rubredoxin